MSKDDRNPFGYSDEERGRASLVRVWIDGEIVEAQPALVDAETIHADDEWLTRPRTLDPSTRVATAEPEWSGALLSTYSADRREYRDGAWHSVTVPVPREMRGTPVGDHVWDMDEDLIRRGYTLGADGLWRSQPFVETPEEPRTFYPVADIASDTLADLDALPDGATEDDAERVVAKGGIRAGVRGLLAEMREAGGWQADAGPHGTTFLVHRGGFMWGADAYSGGPTQAECLTKFDEVERTNRLGRMAMEWLKGCSHAPNDPGECSECTYAFLDALRDEGRAPAIDASDLAKGGGVKDPA